MTALRVLVAEDNEDHRYLMIRAVRRVARDPVEIHEARDGHETLERIRGTGASEGQLPPHLVFLDLKMPKHTGFDVLREVKTDPEVADIPIVVLSSSSRPEDIDAAYALGTNSYVTKADDGDLWESLPQVAEYWTVRAGLPHLHG